MTDVGTPQERRASSSSGAASSVASSRSAMDRRPSLEKNTPEEILSAPPAPPVSQVETRSRKRASTIETGVGGSARPSPLALDALPLGDAGRDLICLCTPAPKVPRPRNAFILYRQHHQGQVVTDNPGLANPEISKIIGEQWRTQPEDVKEYWKSLAEEEKLRHQRQYPDYRYQPRRGAKGVGRPGSATGDEPGRCPKCGGRYITTPKTPSTPLMTPTAGRVNMQPYMTRDGRGFEGEQHRHTLFQGKPHFPFQQGGMRDADEEYSGMSPSDPKRRRFNQSGQYTMAPPTPNPSHPFMRQTRQSSIGNTPCHSPGYGPGPLPGPSSLSRQGHGNAGMGPPPPRNGPAPYVGPGRGPDFDESLRLPPLQTQIPPPTPTQDPQSTPGPGLGITNPRGEPQCRTLDALIMAISYINKLKVLDKISPPYVSPNPAGLENETRGAIIAVEGPDARLLEQVGTALYRGLMSLGEVDLKTWDDGPSDSCRDPNRPEEDVRMGAGVGSAGSSRKNSHEGPSLSDMYVDHMQKMIQWHEKSRQIIKHITTSPGGAVDGPPGGRRLSEGEAMAQQHPSAPAKTPVALMPGGFSMTISDRQACRIPLMDSYHPVDHWQWVATMWRGIVGPDLVVYVKPCPAEEVSRVGVVELRGNELMVVRVPASGFDGKMDRRVCFEVVEWLRGGSFKAGYGRV